MVKKAATESRFSKHDKLYRKLYAHPKMVEDLIVNFVNERFVKDIDFTTLKELKSKFVTDEYRDRESDVIYEMKLNGDSVYFYILIEFQSTVDRFMPVRMLTYIMLFYQDWLKKQTQKDKKTKSVDAIHLNTRKLPAVFPILLYNGEAEWKTPVELKELIDVRYKALEKYIPDFAYYKIIETDFSPDGLKEIDSINAAMFALEQAGVKDFGECALRLTRVLKKEAHGDLKRDFRLWLNQLIRGYGIKEKDADKILDELEAEKMTNLEKNMKNAFKEAEEKGVEKKARETALKMLELGDDIKKVSIVTGLSEKEIKNLKAASKKAA